MVWNFFEMAFISKDVGSTPPDAHRRLKLAGMI
jgi:hypothetical protein